MHISYIGLEKSCLCIIFCQLTQKHCWKISILKLLKRSRTQNYQEMYQLLSYWAYMRHERLIVHQFLLLIYKSLRKNSRVMLFHKLEIALNCFTMLRSSSVYIKVLYCSITQNYLETYQLLSYWAYMRHERLIVHQFLLLIYKSLRKKF